MNVRPMGNITLYFFVFRLTGLLIVFYCLVLFIKYTFVIKKVMKLFIILIFVSQFGYFLFFCCVFINMGFRMS
jgi:hypothetical protein